MCVLLSLRSTLSRDDPNFMTEIGGKLREKWLACWMNLDALSPNLAFLERRERILQLNCHDVMRWAHLARYEATRWRNGAEQWLAIQKYDFKSVGIRLKPFYSHRPEALMRRKYSNSRRKSVGIRMKPFYSHRPEALMRQVHLFERRYASSEQRAR